MIKLLGCHKIPILCEQNKNMVNPFYFQQEINNLKPRSEEGDDIPTRLKKLVAEESGVPESKITRDSSFREDLGMDSLNKVEMISKCDDELGVEIPDEDAEKLTTYGQLLDYITEKLNNPNPSS